MNIILNVLLPLTLLATPFIIVFLVLKRKKSANTAYKFAVGLALVAAFLIIWMNLAVGIIGDSDDPANLMYVGVLAVGAVGALIARFEPVGMVRALFATALAQALVAVVALVAGMLPFIGLIVVNLFFVALFTASALLFRQAAQQQTPEGAALES